MAERWNTFDGGATITLRLATIAVRVQRLMVAKKLRDVQNLMRMHAPAIAALPGGRKILADVDEQLEALTHTLQVPGEP